MRSHRFIVAVLVLLWSAAIYAAESRPIDFDTDIVPIFSKAGCNAAACHGGAAGRGGFRLSLFGGDPEFDYRSIVWELESRRINLRHPEYSLLLAKPTEMLEHGGGERLEYDGPLARTLTSWIAQGALRLRDKRLEGIRLQTSTLDLDRLPAELEMRVMAEFDDGSRRDVTGLAVYAANDSSSLEVSEQGHVRVLNPGRHVLIVRYGNQVEPLQITAPYPNRLETVAFPRANWIDDSINGTLQSLRLPPSPQADDAKFLRRVHLDLTGRLPTPGEVTTYLADTSPGKRQEVVDRLLDSDAFGEYWTFRLAKLLRLRPPGNDVRAAEVFRRWISKRVKSDASWKDSVLEMLTAEGDTHEIGPANLHRLIASAREQAEYVSEVFMGVTLRCANCHNHPLDKWTQNDYHGLAQLFAKLERGQVVRWGLRGEVTHPRTGLPASARIPGGVPLDDLQRGRQDLAEWLIDADNPYFAKAMVNRLWKALMGRGLVDPPDDLRATNPASHPELLDRLAAHFRDTDYRIRPTLRLICGSAAYARSRRAIPANRSVTQYYSRAAQRTMEPEVLADALADILGVPYEFGDEPLGTRAVTLVDPQTPSSALDALGRCDLAASCESDASAMAGLATQLSLLNGPLLNRALADTQGRLSKLMAQANSDEEIIREYYLRALSRPPRTEELAWWLRQNELDGDSSSRRRERCEDFVWSLLTSYEFAHVD